MTPYGSREPRGDINIWDFQEHLWQKAYRNLDATLTEGSRRSLDTKNDSFYYGPLQYAQYVLLLESKWLKSVPLSARKGWVGFRSVDIVRVRIPNVIDINTKSDLVMDFYLDANSHLPISTRDVNGYEKNGTADKEGSVTYRDYVDVKGIKLPQKLTPWRPLFADPDTKGSEEYRYQLDVDVDEGIFSRPLNNHMGRYEWRKRK